MRETEFRGAEVRGTFPNGVWERGGREEGEQCDGHRPPLQFRMTGETIRATVIDRRYSCAQELPLQEIIFGRR
jgi:hypothetical protein